MVPRNLPALRCKNTGNASEGLDGGVNNELQGRVVIGLKACILQFEPAFLGMGQGFQSCRDAVNVMGSPPAGKFGQPS